MIPKIIHYCWFGGKPIPENVWRYIDSWKKFLPDYDIKEWNEDNEPEMIEVEIENDEVCQVEDEK